MGDLSWEQTLKTQHLSSGRRVPSQTLPVVGEHCLPHLCMSVFALCQTQISAFPLAPSVHKSLLSFCRSAIPTLICRIPFPLGLDSSFSTSMCSQKASGIEMMWSAWHCHAGRGGDEQMVVICGCSARAIFNHLAFAQLQCCHISSAYLKINIHEAKNERLWIFEVLIEFANIFKNDTKIISECTSFKNLQSLLSAALKTQHRLEVERRTINQIEVEK